MRAFLFLLSLIINHIDSTSASSQESSIRNLPASLTITEFFDYQCGFCRKMHSVLKQFQQKNPQATIIYRPLPLLGAESKILAQAALAAQQQGKFQLMHEWLMTEG